MDQSKLANRRANLSPAKRALLELRFKHQGAKVSIAQTIPRRMARDSAPLSFAQQRLWFLDQLDPGSTVYNVPGSLRIRGLLDVTALQRSVNEILRRHEVLRTTFSMVEGQPVQIIAPSLSLSLPVIDLADHPKNEREDEARRFVSEEAGRPFDLARGPLMRVTLLRLDHEDHILLLTMHHIVSDGWSMGVLYRELLVLYEAFSHEQPSPLPDLPIQYADFSIWQRNWLQGEALDSQLSYWKKQLKGPLAILNLPLDRPRPAVQSHRGARQSIILSQALLQSLKALSQKEGVTLFMTLLAAFQVLLHRNTGQDDIVVGTPIANRNRIEIEGLIGFFVNTLVLRNDLSGNPTFNELLARVREVALGAYAHQDLPFEKLIEELKPERNLSQSPLFEVMFVLQNASSRDLESPGLTLSPVQADNGTAKFALTLHLHEEAWGLRGSLQYATDLFNTTTIERMLGHFQALLEGIVANPEQRISELSLLSEAEKRQLLEEWNDTETDYPKDQCVHQLFEAQAERTPDATAVVFEDQRITYQELNQRANQLAHYLRKLGVGPEILVAICVERSIEMIVGLLAILKAGGAYVPIDPSYPAGRREFMLAEAQASVLLTQGSLFEEGWSRIENIERCSTIDPHIQTVRMDRDWELIAKGHDANPENSITADNLAYVIFTSGSTGQPKGVQITHKSLLNLVFWHRQAFSVTAFDRATQLAGPGFDAAVWELWPYLTVGASIHIPNEMIRLDATSLRDWLVTHTITISFVPTALAENLITLEWPQETALRILLTGGDALHIYPPETLPFLVFNNYGPTECTVVAASAQIWPNARPAHPPTIGRPIANTEIYILDANLNPVGIAVPGELYIGGNGCARGYLNDADLTTAKFIKHSFIGEPARRFYKTGDLARYLPDGNIEFLGRLDHQVKIRGYRIELGEIEAVLSRHPGIQTAVVIAREHIRTNKLLVAYVVLHHECTVKNSELRDFLKQQLPDYMIPSAFVFLDVLPLTPNGKVDHRALPDPDQNRPEMVERYQAPRTATEEKLAGIWAEVLGIDQVGTHDNFFELGGHSLLAVRLFVEIEKTIGRRLPLATIFQAPTIGQLAGILKEEEWSESQVDLWSTYPSALVPFQANGL